MNRVDLEHAEIHFELLPRLFELARWNRWYDQPGLRSFNRWWQYRPYTDARAVRVAEVS